MCIYIYIIKCNRIDNQRTHQKLNTISSHSHTQDPRSAIIVGPCCMAFTTRVSNAQVTSDPLKLETFFVTQISVFPLRLLTSISLTTKVFASLFPLTFNPFPKKKKKKHPTDSVNNDDNVCVSVCV